MKYDFDNPEQPQYHERKPLFHREFKISERKQKVTKPIKAEKINHSDFLSWANEAEILYASNGKGREIYVRHTGGYVIYENGVEVWTGLGGDWGEAVRQYNK
jgi:hypothetical protein